MAVVATGVNTTSGMRFTITPTFGISSVMRRAANTRSGTTNEKMSIFVPILDDTFLVKLFRNATNSSWSSLPSWSPSNFCVQIHHFHYIQKRLIQTHCNLSYFGVRASQIHHFHYIQKRLIQTLATYHTSESELLKSTIFTTFRRG